eukprot:8912472-Pyramimonas_sp.AAC.2
MSCKTFRLEYSTVCSFRVKSVPEVGTSLFPSLFVTSRFRTPLRERIYQGTHWYQESLAIVFSHSL